MKPYEEYNPGQVVEVVDGDDLLGKGTVIRTGSLHAAVTLDNGESYDVPYDMLRRAGLVRRAAAEVLREEERDGRKFSLVKEEANKDGQLTMQFKVFMGDKAISESEALVTNVYDTENGWSAPDDFDENKVDLIKSQYESGFDLLVDSYTNIEQTVMEGQAEAAAQEDATPPEPEGEPAFAPGAEPSDGGDIGGDMGGGALMDGAGEEEIVDEGNLAGGPDAAAAPAGEAATPAEAPGEATAASLERRSFARSVVSAKNEDESIMQKASGLTARIAQLGGGTYIPAIEATGMSTVHKGSRLMWSGSKEKLGSYLNTTLNSIKKYRLGSRKQSSELLRNPQHRINPILRQEMARRGIDSGATNDLELADELKNFDFGTTDKK